MSLFSKTVPPQAPQVAPAPLVQFDLEAVQNALPKHLRSTVTPALVDRLNQVSTDPLVAEQVRDNFVSYSSILKDGKFKTEEYLNAVAYVSYKLMNYSNREAYERTFPHRVSSMIAQGKSQKDISSFVAAYNRGKLVNLVLEQTLVPTWVLNQDIYQEAINTQVDLMRNAVSEKVRAEAANSILTHLAKPKETKLQIDIGENESKGIQEMKDLMVQLAQGQRDAIASGQAKTIDVASMPLIKKEVPE